MLKKLFSHTAIYGLAPQVPKIAGVLSLPIITQYLTIVDYGVYGVITAVAGILITLGNLGLKICLVNSFYKSPGQYKWAWRQIYGFLMLWNIPYSIILGIVLYLFIPQEAREHQWAIIALNVLPIVFFGPTYYICVTYYELKRKPLQIGIRVAIFGILTVLLNVYFIAWKHLGYMGWFLSTCIVTMLYNISYWVALNKKHGLTPIFNFKWRFIKRSLAVSVPTMPHYFSHQLLSMSDRFIMKLTKVPTGDIGLYNVALTVGNVVNNMAAASTQAVNPLMNEAFKKKRDYEARYLIWSLQASSLAITFIMCLWLKEIFYVLIKNASLRHVYPLGIILVMAFNYRPMYSGVTAKLFFLEKTKMLLKITFLAGVINIVLNIALIPFYGYQVAAYSLFFSLMYMGYAGFYLKGFKEINQVRYHPIFWLSTTIILTIAAYFLVDINWYIKGGITFFAVILSVIILKKFSAKLALLNKETNTV